MDMTQKVAVYGAYGHTGRFVVAELLGGQAHTLAAPLRAERFAVDASEPAAVAQKAETFVRQERKVGRNEACPEGSGFRPAPGRREWRRAAARRRQPGRRSR